MTKWFEIGYVDSDITCPRCGCVLLIDDNELFATCTRCLTEFTNVPPEDNNGDGT